MLKIIGIAYIVLMVGLFIEAYFYTELDPESRKFLEKRENKLKKEKNGNKRNN